MNWAVVLLLFAIAMIVIERNRTINALRSGDGEDDRPDSERMDRASDHRPLGHDPETERELKELRERVKVLERITVDGREAKAIAEEIEQLRDS